MVVEPPAQFEQPERFLFVSGCPRSGTTVMTTLLNWHDSVLIGQERFAMLLRFTPELFEPGLFSPGRTADFRPGECAYQSFEQMREYSAHYANPKDFGNISSYPVRGDKITHLYKAIDRFDRDDWSGAEITVLHMIRNIEDVACSYETRRQDQADKWGSGYKDAIKDWSESVERMYTRMHDGSSRVRIGIVEYESAFEGDLATVTDAIARVYAFVGLEFGEKQEEGVGKIHKASAFFKKRRKVHGDVLEALRRELPPDALRKYEYLRSRGI